MWPPQFLYFPGFEISCLRSQSTDTVWCTVAISLVAESFGFKNSVKAMNAGPSYVKSITTSGTVLVCERCLSGLFLSYPSLLLSSWAYLNISLKAVRTCSRGLSVLNWGLWAIFYKQWELTKVCEQLINAKIRFKDMKVTNEIFIKITLSACV